MKGKTFNNWKVLRQSLKKDSSGNLYWICKCICGKIKSVRGTTLRNGESKSCSHINPNFKHGLYKSFLYKTWTGMKERCNTPSTTNYKNYGGRGIKYDPKWNNFLNFKNDMYFKWVWAKKKYFNQKLSIERKDVNGNYCFENCIFIPLKDQAKNRRPRNCG